MFYLGLTSLNGRRSPRLFLFLFVVAFALDLPGARNVATARSQSPLSIVSAASYGPALAPNGIAAAFGQNLTARTESATALPLPTTLSGITVRVAGRPAGLFFAAPTQINFLVPEETAPGTAAVEVFNSGNTRIAQGSMLVSANAPAIFTANANGRGVPAASILRVAPNGVRSDEPVAQLDQQTFAPKPIDLGVEGSQVFLILFLNGIRSAGVAATRVFIGGRPVESGDVLYAGPAPGFAGLDQINLRLSRSLRGRVKLVVDTDNALPSNEVELEIVPPPASGADAPEVASFSKPRVMAGERVEIMGRGFAPDSAVHIGGVRATVIEVFANRLLVEVPFGVRAGRVSVQTQRGEAASQSLIAVRTSISGFVTDTARAPLRGVAITAQIGGMSVRATTGDNGSFVLPDLPVTAENPAADAEIQIDASTTASALNYPRLAFRKQAVYNRDNQLDAPVAMQIVSGPGTGGPQPSLAAVSGNAAAQSQTPARLETGGFALEIPAGATVSFPANTQPAPINLTLVDGAREQNDLKQSRVPANLPPGVFSPRIVQITPFGATVNPGAKLIFPNLDNLPAGAAVKFYRFEQNASSSKLGQFVEAGEARVSADGKIETPAGAIRDFTYYFAATAQTTTVVVGRVVEETGTVQPARPVQQVIVQTRGQSDFTDGSGGFAPRNVPAKPGDSVQVSAAHQRPNGRVDYADKLVPARAGGLTNAETLPLPPPNRNQPPVLLAPPSVTLNAGETRDVKFTAYDPDPNQTVTINSSIIPQTPSSNQTPAFSRIIPNQTGEHIARLTPGANDVGEYALELSAVDNHADPARVTRFITVSVQGRPGAFTLSQPTVVCDAALPSGPAVRLSWTASSLAAVYDLYRNEMLVAQNLAATGYTDKAVTAGVSYIYRVTARNAAGARDSAAVNLSIPAGVCASAQITIGLGQATGNAATGGSITIPVLLGDVTGRGVIAYEFDLGFDPAALQFQELDRSNTLSGAMTVAHNPTTPGKLRVAAVIANELAGPGRTLLSLKFRVVGASGATTTLVWEKFLLNEGDPPVNKINGSFTVN